MACRRGVLLVWAGGQSLLVAALNLVSADIDVSGAVAVAVYDPRVAGKVGLGQALEAYHEWTRVEQRLTGIHGRRPEGNTQVTHKGVDELGITGDIPHAVDGSGEIRIRHNEALIGIQRIHVAEILDDAVLRLNRAAGSDRPSVIFNERTAVAKNNGGKRALRVVRSGRDLNLLPQRDFKIIRRSASFETYQGSGRGVAPEDAVPGVEIPFHADGGAGRQRLDVPTESLTIILRKAIL